MKARHVIAAGALTLGALGVATPAHATVDPPNHCVTVSSTLGSPTGRDDSGFIGGTWAKDTFVRTTEICEKPAPEDLAKLDVAAPLHYYHAYVSDSGTFKADHNPATGASIPDTTGTMVGSYTEDFTSTATLETGQQLNGGPPFSGNDPTTTGNWVKYVWLQDDNFAGEMNQDWTWTYTTCGGGKGSESWTDAALNNAGDPASGAGGITGKVCPSCPPSPSGSPSTTPSGTPSTSPSSSPSGSPSGTPTTTPTSSPSSSPSATAHPTPTSTSTPPAQGTIGGGGNLPTTGTKTLLFGAGGALLILIGGAMWALARKRDEYDGFDGDAEDDDQTGVIPQV